MSRDINKLQNDVKIALVEAMSEMDDLGIKYFVDSTLRTTEEQAAYFAQGRKPLLDVNQLRTIAGFGLLPESENRYTITNCDGVTAKSNHQSGRAVDVVPTDSRGRPYWPVADSAAWKLIAVVMEKHGFTWGGRWKKFPDFPHYEMV
jgi:peptidoglycan L-alanyl-D-glutamate endopeptidase CwlK